MTDPPRGHAAGRAAVLAALGSICAALCSAGCLSADPPLRDARARDTSADRGDSRLPEASVDLPPPPPCSYTQPMQFVADTVDASVPCGAGDGTCISGTITFSSKTVMLQPGDAGEAYIFGNSGAPPIVVYRVIDPPRAMPFKIPNIAQAITDACSGFEVGGRYDKGGDNKGVPRGPGDISLAVSARLRLALLPGRQLNGLKLTLE